MLIMAWISGLGKTTCPVRLPLIARLLSTVRAGTDATQPSQHLPTIRDFASFLLEFFLAPQCFAYLQIRDAPSQTIVRPY